MSIIKVIVNGASGKMGQVAIEAISSDPRLELVAKTGKEDNLTQAIHSLAADVVVDVTTAHTVWANTCQIINAGARPVIGTSGLSDTQILELQARCKAIKLGGIIAPNFSIGAILMMRYAKDAARYYADMEIIEMHHAGKKDSPSGTALKTAAMLAAMRSGKSSVKSNHETIPGARGATYQDIPIHAVRLPGVLATQEVIFGSSGEMLSIKHHTQDRSTFIPGIRLACNQVMQLKDLVYGLEHLLENLESAQLH